jgi:hypothetical protein
MSKKRKKSTHSKTYHFIERLVDYLIPPSLVVLLGIIIIELFFHDIADTYHTLVITLDYIVVGIFVFDLYFKYQRIRNVEKFLKEAWLDILAVFPFFLLFRIFGPLLFISDISKEAKEVQLIFHESLELSKSGSKIVKEAELAGKLSRTRMLTAAFRSIGRAPRFLKAMPFFERPKRRKK